MAATGQNRQLLDPLLLNLPEHRSEEERQRSFETMAPVFDPDLKRWSVPFIMAPVNSAVVRRSHSLLRKQDQGYGPDFEYHERLLTSQNWPRLSAYLTTFGTGALVLAMQSSLGRKLIQKVMPDPGVGPTETAKDQGFFKCILIGETASGKKEFLSCFHQGDPGNRATTKFLAEAALTLVEDRNDLPGGTPFGGILTPATGLGVPFQQRLATKGLHWKPFVVPNEGEIAASAPRERNRPLTDRPV